MKSFAHTRRHVLQILLFFLAAALLWFLIGARSVRSTSHLSTPHVAEQYLSMEDLKSGIRRGDECTKTLTYLYYPAWLPENAELHSINVHENYVALHWNGPDDLMFEWWRPQNGQDYLEHQKETQSLTLWASSPHETWSSTTENGCQYYWVQDDCRFSMYVPNHLATDDIFFEAVLYDLTE